MSDAVPPSIVTVPALLALAERAFLGNGASPAAAAAMARVHVDAERAGIASHGMARIPALCAQLRAGRIRGDAAVTLSRPRPGVIVADAGGGFPQLAFEAGFEPCVAAASALGVATLVVRNGWAANVMGWHVERFAERGFLALGFANVPAAISPFGGTRPVFGTNPITCAIPQSGKPPIVIDQASSVVAKSEIVERAAAGMPIPFGWALDAQGQPTDDPQAALAGSMVPAGGYKGAGIALIVELLAAILSGSDLSIEAPPLAKTDAAPVRLAQTFIVMDPTATAGSGWRERVAALTGAMEAQAGVRVPGARRFVAQRKHDAEGIAVAASLLTSLASLGSSTPGASASSGA